MKKRHVDAYRLSEEVLLKEYKLQRKEHFIPVKGYGLQVRVQETGSGSPLLLIHGGPNAGSTWLELASRLPETRCLILDRPGCGLSDGLSYKNLTLDKLKDLIVGVLDSVMVHFKLEKCSILASSFGGYWAIRYALIKPEKVDKLILEGAPALVEGSTLPSFMKSVGNPFLRWLIPKMPGSVSSSEKTLKEIGHTKSIENGLLPDTFMDWYVSLWNNTDTIKHDFEIISKVTKGGKQNPEFLLRDNELEGLNVRTLWLWGKDDAFAGSEVARRIHGKVKQSNLVEFENGGHLPWLDDPKKHASLINEFLAAKSSLKAKKSSAVTA